jgi:hypothetical protein
MNMALPAVKKDPEVEKYISDLVGALTDPILCWPGYEEDKPPKDFKELITIQRLLENMCALKENRGPQGTDAEVCWYLSTKSLDGPIGDIWTRIYQYCFTKTRECLRREVPGDLRVDDLSDYEMNYHLIPFKRWIYKKRCERRKALDREEKKARKEVTSQEKLELQPAMFDLSGSVPT